MPASCTAGTWRPHSAATTVPPRPATPGVLTYNYNPLTQAGIAIRNHRSADQDAELAAFVAFLTDFTSPPTPDSPVTSVLRKYCYTAP